MPAQPSVSGAQLQRVVWTGTRFVATASALDGGGVFLDSSDGLIWNRQATESADQLPVVLAAGPRGVVATGSTEDNITAWSSEDGLTWTVRPDAFPAPAGKSGYSGPTSVTVQGLVPTDDGWLAVGREDPVCQLDCGTNPIRPVVWRSSDGLAWISVPATGLGRGGMDAIARNSDDYVAVGLGESRAAVWTSSDGTTWTAVPDTSHFHARPSTDSPHWIEMNGVAAGHGVVVAVGMDGPYGDGQSSVRAWWSLDGRTWSEATVKRSLSGQVFTVTSTPDGFLATGPSGGDSCLGGIWASADGRAWTCEASDPAFAGFGPYGAAASPSVIVAVGLDTSDEDSEQGLPGAVWRKRLP